MSKHERFTTAVNDSTGDLIKTKTSNQQAYADNWERIFWKKEDASDTEPVSSRPEEEYVTHPFLEEELPEGMIEDEI